MDSLNIFPQAIRMAEFRFTPLQMELVNERVSQLREWGDPTSDLSTLDIRPLIDRGAFEPIYVIDEVGNVLEHKKLRIVFGVIERRKEIIVLAVYDSFNQDPVVIESITRVFDHYVECCKPDSQPVK